jgi:hypothetical protein
VLLAAVTLALGLAAQPLLAAADVAADLLSDPARWAEAVRGR